MLKRFFKFLFSSVGTFLTVTLFAVISLFPGWIGKIEGRLFPVFSEMSVEVISEGATLSEIRGDFFVNRPGCDFLHVEWKLQSPYQSVLAEVTFPEGMRGLTPGINSFGPWLISIRKEDLIQRSFAEVYHDCHYLPWLTITRFYP